MNFIEKLGPGLQAIHQPFGRYSMCFFVRMLIRRMNPQVRGTMTLEAR